MKRSNERKFITAFSELVYTVSFTASICTRIIFKSVAFLIMKLNKNEEKIDKIEKNQPKIWPQYLACWTATLAITSGSTHFSWSSPTISKLVDSPEYNTTLEEVSYVTVIQTLSMIVFTPIYSKLNDTIGRKYSLLQSGVAMLIGWILIASFKNIYVIYVAKVFAGLADACYFAVIPTYIAEVSTPVVRDNFGNVLMVMVFFGQFLINCVGYYTSIQLSALIMLILPSIFLILFAFMPESPYYSIMKNDYEAAKKSLMFLRQMECVEPELEQLKTDISRQMSESARFKDLFLIKSNQKALIIANFARTVQQLAGIGTFAMYSQYIFKEARGGISIGVEGIIFTSCLTVTNGFSNFFSRKLGKKMSMVYSCLGCGVMLLTESAYFFLQDHTKVNLSAVNWFPILGLSIYVCFFSIGLSPIPNMLMGEIFSTNIRKHAVMVSNIVLALFLCIIPKLFQVLMTNFGLFLPFVVFTICTLVGAVASYFIIPETKGKTLEEIQQMLKGNIK